MFPAWPFMGRLAREWRLGLFDFLGVESRKKRFARRVMARLASMGWRHPMSYDAVNFVIELGGEAGRISLATIFQDWSRYPRRDQAAALDDAIAFVFELGPAPSFKEAEALLVPTIRARSLVQAMLSEPLDDPKADLEDAWRPLCDHLSIHIAIDRPHSLAFVGASTLKDWGCSFDQVFEIAMTNLRNKEPPIFERHEDGFYLSTCKDFNDIARLLIPEQFPSIELLGVPVAVAASRDCLMVAGAEDPVALEAMARFAPGFLDQHSRPISYAPIILEEGRWRSYDPPPGLYGANALHALQKAHDYEQQRPLILGRLHRTGRPEEVGQFSLMTTDEGVRSVALWTAPSCLLPRADLIVLRTGAGPTLVRAWEDVEAACGGLSLEPQTASPYHCVTAWPDPAAMERIAAAPEPAWARGKGVGVSNGRLTMFG
jgi:hypothetical protein